LQQQPNFTAATSLYKIHNQSWTDFKKWITEWSEHAQLTLEINPDQTQVKLPKQQLFNVIHKSEINQDETFTIQLKPMQKVSYQSGDLLAIYPKDDPVARYYSIGLKGKDILLSIKKHEFGICSTYFSELTSHDQVIASIQKNKHFHFPKKSQAIVCIANGTGIAPFLGMLQENDQYRQVHLFWGGRTQASFDLYQKIIEKALTTKQLSSLHLAYSREPRQPKYVQDLLQEHQELIANTLQNNGTILICGSIAMEKGVKKALEEITMTFLQSDLSSFKHQIKSDCY
jgi:sulfite reductase (NADPH) flavoprotein alpha-component